MRNFFQNTPYLAGRWGKLGNEVQLNKMPKKLCPSGTMLCSIHYPDSTRIFRFIWNTNSRLPKSVSQKTFIDVFLTFSLEQQSNLMKFLVQIAKLETRTKLMRLSRCSHLLLGMKIYFINSKTPLSN